MSKNVITRSTTLKYILSDTLLDMTRKVDSLISMIDKENIYDTHLFNYAVCLVLAGKEDTLEAENKNRKRLGKTSTKLSEGFKIISEQNRSLGIENVP